MTTSRRSFLSLFGLAGAAVAAPTLAVATVATVATVPATIPVPKRKPLTIILRRDKGFALTYDEMDNNFQNLAERLNEIASEQKCSGRKPSWA